MLDIKHVVDFEQHVELLNPLPFTFDEENKDNLNLLSCVKSITH
jgi:hypothetical protein